MTKDSQRDQAQDRGMVDHRSSLSHILQWPVSLCLLIFYSAFFLSCAMAASSFVSAYSV